MNISATLKDEALPKVIELSQEFRDEAGQVKVAIKPPTASSKDAPLKQQLGGSSKGIFEGLWGCRITQSSPLGQLS